MSNNKLRNFRSFAEWPHLMVKLKLLLCKITDEPPFIHFLTEMSVVIVHKTDQTNKSKYATFALASKSIVTLSSLFSVDLLYPCPRRMLVTVTSSEHQVSVVNLICSHHTKWKITLNWGDSDWPCSTL